MKNWSKLLIVDDEPKAHTVLENMLASEEYVLLHARNGRQALLLAAELKPDVVLLDVMMPEMDGFETCRRLRANKATEAMPVIMLTALDDRESRIEGLEAGADDYISKPFDALELRTRLRTITRLNRFRTLYEVRSRFEAVVDAAPEGIVVTDPDGTIVLTNPAFERLVPTGEGTLNFFDCLDAEQSAAWRDALDACHPGDATPVLPDVTLVRHRTAGTLVEVTGCLHVYEGVPLFHFHVRDVTERKVIEAKLRQTQRVELIGQLAGSIIHDVNNMMTAIYGYAELLELRDDAQNLKYRDRVLESTIRSQQLLRSILSFARGATSGVMRLEMGKAIAEAGGLVRGMIGRRCELEIVAEPDLPPFDADPNDLLQVLMNLCVNAKDAMPEGGTISVRISTRDVDAREAAAQVDAKPGPHLVLSVSDSGSGISPEHMPKLFDPFFSTKAADKGTGLGLATVLRLVRHYRGFVTVESEVGRGTCVSCLVPVATAEPPFQPALSR
jgi:two-component system, cell cycle sensor histidine kinase and response regulator CckA